ncbi:MAG TPA: SDR family oxidoreductase [Stellaceae bacterium]|nr:SDR family oxidoreductase [Stellaceae bacterium]
MANVIVTGGSRGLGLAMAKKLAAAGHRVIAVARHESAPLKAAAAGGKIAFRAFDLADIAGIAALVKGIRKEFGPIFGLVNNAAIGPSGLLATMREVEIERVVRLNTLSPLVMTRHVVRAMLAAGSGGRIVNIASITAATGFSGLAAYSATKASLIGMTRALAREVGTAGITVNAVAPGFIDTDMTESLSPEDRERIVRRSALRRLADADDVAGAVAFLLSDDAKSITGIVLTVDAGSTV